MLCVLARITRRAYVSSGDPEWLEFTTSAYRAAYGRLCCCNLTFAARQASVDNGNCVWLILAVGAITAIRCGLAQRDLPLGTCFARVCGRRIVACGSCVVMPACRAVRACRYA